MSVAGQTWRCCSRTIQVAPQPCLKCPYSRGEAVLTALGGQAARFWAKFTQHLAPIQIFWLFTVIRINTITMLLLWDSGQTPPQGFIEPAPPSSRCAVSYRWLGSVPQTGAHFGGPWANTGRFEGITSPCKSSLAAVGEGTFTEQPLTGLCSAVCARVYLRAALQEQKSCPGKITAEVMSSGPWHPQSLFPVPPVPVAFLWGLLQKPQQQAGVSGIPDSAVMD